MSSSVPASLGVLIAKPSVNLFENYSREVNLKSKILNAVAVGRGMPWTQVEVRGDTVGLSFSFHPVGVMSLFLSHKLAPK